MHEVRQYSRGGAAVATSLALVGWKRSEGVALTETEASPRKPGRVLVQNAWNVISADMFERMARSYPPRIRTRMWLRRRFARLNLARAESIVVLSEAMADCVRARTGREPIVVPVTMPLDLQVIQVAPTEVLKSIVFVPGTVTWYKRPWVALEVAKDLGFSEVIFAGRDDGSRCWQYVQKMSLELDLSVSREIVSRNAMVEELQMAAVTCVPSGLESLSFSVGEAALYARDLIASSIPVHREVATRLGIEPRWLGHTKATPAQLLENFDWPAERAKWSALAEAMS